MFLSSELLFVRALCYDITTASNHTTHATGRKCTQRRCIKKVRLVNDIIMVYSYRLVVFGSFMLSLHLIF